MFTPEDFELKLEDQLKQRIINDEIDGCDDVAVLRNSLKQCSGLMMRYQHMLNRILKEQILKQLEDFADGVKT
jgi:hypothetical protein